jgi:hypothetical protein
MHPFIFFPSGAAAEQHPLHPEGCDQPARPAAMPARLSDQRPPLHPAGLAGGPWHYHWPAQPPCHQNEEGPVPAPPGRCPRPVRRARHPLHCRLAHGYAASDDRHDGGRPPTFVDEPGASVKASNASDNCGTCAAAAGPAAAAGGSADPNRRSHSCRPSPLACCCTSQVSRFNVFFIAQQRP